MQIKELGEFWIRDGLMKEREKLEEVRKSHEKLQHKDGTFAMSVYRLITIREKLVDIWELELNKINRALTTEEAHGQPTTTVWCNG